MTFLPDGKKEIIASRMKVARERSGLSQSQVAKMLDLSRPAISEIEAGRRKVSADELVKLAEIYAVDVDWLVGKGEDKINEYRDKLYLAARNAKNLNDEDLDKVINLLSSLKSPGKNIG
jgi:transcriptional regulator with XRE-family HTH domain